MAVTLIILAQASQAGDQPIFLQTGMATQPTNVTSNSAVLKGTVNPNGLSTTVYFYSTVSFDSKGRNVNWGTSPTQNIGNGFSPVEISYTLNVLKPGTTYYYTIKATNNDGSKNGATVRFT